MSEMDAQSTSTETQTSAPATTSQDSTPAASTASPAPASSPDATAGTEVEQTAAPSWTPDFKFKAAGAEHEIPEMYRGLIKDQKTLEEVKRLHEKAYGLDTIAQSRDALKQQIAQVYAPKIQEYETVSRNFAKLSHFVENKDFDSFFEGLGIPQKDVVDWIQHKIDLANASPEVRAAYEQNRQLMAQQWDQQQQLSQYQEQALQMEQAQAYNHIHQYVSQAASEFAQAYDSRMGEGAFIEAVISRGLQITAANGGREPALEQVVELMKRELTQLGVAPQVQQQMQMPGSQGSAPAAPKQKPTLPVIPAGGQSPVQTPIKSMEDLKKRAAAFGV